VLKAKAKGENMQIKLQNDLQKRVYEIIDEVGKSFDLTKVWVVQQGIIVDENGLFALKVATQDKEDWEHIKYIKTVEL